jgi:hypothetical protein
MAKQTTATGLVEKNGIARPKDGSTTARVWEIADKLQAKGQAARGDVIAAAEKEGISAATVATQFQRWRVHNGHAGKAPARKKVAKKAPAKKIAKKAAKKAVKKPAAKKASKPRAPKAPKAPAAEASA